MCDACTHHRALAPRRYARNEPPPLFLVNVVLENSRVDFVPTMINLTQMVNTVSKEMITIIAVVPRLTDVLLAGGDGARGKGGRGGDAATVVSADAGGDEASVAVETAGRREALPSFYEVISNDEDILKILVSIMNGMSECTAELQKCAVSRVLVTGARGCD